MKVQRALAVAFAVALGYPKATKWDNDKLTRFLKKSTTETSADDVPNAHADFYKKLGEAKDDITIVAGEKAAKGEAAKPEKPEKSAATSAKTAKADKKAEKKEKAPVKKVDRDAWGCAEGTISAKVNAVVTKDWQSEQEIAEAAGITLDQARGRLYYAAEDSLMERERLIRYRWTKTKAKE